MAFPWRTVRKIWIITGSSAFQFGSYGFQPLDHWATISRAEQQRIVVQELLRALAGGGRRLGVEHRRGRLGPGELRAGF